MKLIIAGSRDMDISIDLIDALLGEYDLYDKVSEVVSGGASGVDKSGEDWTFNCLRLPRIFLKKFEPDWELYGKRAGPIRNAKMAIYADVLLLIWDGKSKGSANMKEEMQKRGKPIYEVVLRNEKGNKRSNT